MRRSVSGGSGARVASVPLAPTGKYVVPSSPPSFRPVVFARGVSHGAIGCWTGPGDRAVDLGLDFYDAANELPDGSLPGREAA